jgi:hypothetical protein
MRWAGHIERIRFKVDAFKILDRKPEGKKKIERIKSGCCDKIKTDIKEMCMSVTALSDSRKVSSMGVAVNFQVLFMWRRGYSFFLLRFE